MHFGCFLIYLFKIFFNILYHLSVAQLNSSLRVLTYSKFFA